MTSAELKASILDRAVRGLLTATWRTTHPSRPSSPVPRPSSPVPRPSSPASRPSSPASRPSSPVPRPSSPVSDPPFPIPDSWEWVRLGDIGATITGSTPSTKDKSLYGNDIPFIKPAAIYDDHIDYSGQGLSSKGGKVARIVDGGSILMVCIGSIGKAYYTNRPVACNQQINAITPFKDDTKYLLFAMQSPIFQSRAWNESSSTTISILNKSSWGNLPIPLPPLAEQREIVAKIEELMPLVEEYGKAETLLAQLNDNFPTALRKSILQHAVEGRLTAQWRTSHPSRPSSPASRPSSPVSRPSPIDNPPFPIPDSWTWVRLGDIGSVYGGKRIPAGEHLSDTPTKHIYIRVSDMKDGGFVSTENLKYVPDHIYPIIKQYIINKEDVYITVAGTIGRVGKIPAELDGANLTENADRIVFSGLDQDWLIKCLMSFELQQQIKKATKKEGQPKLAIKRIKELLLPLPPLAEQREIVARVEELLKLVEQMKG